MLKKTFSAAFAALLMGCSASAAQIIESGVIKIHISDSNTVTITGSDENLPSNSLVGVRVCEVNNAELIYMDDCISQNGVYSFTPFELGSVVGIKYYEVEASSLSAMQSSVFSISNLIDCPVSELAKDIVALPEEYSKNDLEEIYRHYGYYEYYNALNEDEKEELLSLLKNEAKNPKDFLTYLCDAPALAAVQSDSWLRRKEILMTTYGISSLLMGYDSIGETQQSDLFRNMKKNYSSIGDIVDEFNGKIKGMLSTATNNSSIIKGSSGGATFGPSSPVTAEAFGNENVLAEQGGSTFNDVGDVKWAQSAIDALHNKHVINGYEDGDFKPNSNVTRAEFVKMVSILFELRDEAYLPFKDVSESEWYYVYISRTYADGLIMGAGEYFNPNSFITREDIAVILFRAIRRRFPEFEEAQDVFKDWDDISDYAENAVAQLSGLGIITGTPDGEFLPKSYATRAETAAMLYRLLNKY